MIIRSDSDHLLLITQPDHAALAERILAAWQADGLPGSPDRATILRATRDHDNGWIEPDAAPIVEPATGRLLDFVNAPESIRQGIWPRGVERLHDDPYAAALVAEHAISVYERYREIPAWDPFFDRMEAARAAALERAAPRTMADLRRDYFFVQMADLASLAFCNAWRAAQHLAQYELRLEGSRLIVRPDPFAGAQVPLEIPARRIPNQPYASAAAAAEALRSAAPTTLTGIAAGAALSTSTAP